MRINLKVVAALAAAALAIYLLAPDAFYAALPLLILAACPLSMFLMMRMMSGNKTDEPAASSTPVAPPATPKEESR